MATCRHPSLGDVVIAHAPIHSMTAREGVEAIFYVVMPIDDRVFPGLS